MMTLITKITAVMINMRTEIRIIITMTETTTTTTTIATKQPVKYYQEKTISKLETIILKWK